MKVKIGNRIERWMTLRYFIASGKWQVQTHKPLGRNWVWRTYTPTLPSLERVKRLTGYKLGIDGWWAEGNKITIKEYHKHA